ncbi:MAG: translation initiation factor IF-2 [Candidatus Brocadiia bacterium]
MRIRLYQLARELGVPSKELVAKVKARGIQVKTHMSSVEEPIANALRAEYGSREPAAAEEAEAPAEAEKAEQAAPPKPKAKRPAKAAEKEEEKKEEKKKEEAAPKPSPRRRGKARRTGPAAESTTPSAESPTPSAGTVREYGPHVRIKERRPPSTRQARRARRLPRRGRAAGRRARPAVRRGAPAKVTVDFPVTLRSLSSATGIKAQALMRSLMSEGVMKTMNDTLDEEQVQLLSEAFGVEVELRHERDLEAELLEAEAQPDRPEDLQPRAPVVAFLGHVDHGKTSLLDAIRQTHVVDSESGGITQHTGAYTVTKDDRTVVFLDTPGHEAFTAMRARGAQVTDIVVLVVAADDGVMPQTEEAINHARAAGVPMVVAINKMDLPGANPQRVMQQLANLELLPAKWGGDTEFVEVSAVTTEGLDDLVETLALQAEVLELKANPDKPARGTVIEAELSEGRGSVATVLVRDGTLHRGDIVLCGGAYGRARSLRDDRGREIEQAGPSAPVELSGLSSVPAAGDAMMVLEDLDKAREVAEERQRRAREAQIAEREHVTLENLFATLEEDKPKEMRVVIKADVQGSLEVIRNALNELSTDEVRVDILHAAVGGISDSDILLADASDAVVIGFHVVPETSARQLAEEKQIDIRLYNVIYNLTDDVKAALESRLEPERRENVVAHCQVRQVFRISKVGNVAGCYVTDGRVNRNNRVRVIRDSIVVYDGQIGSLKRFKDDVREVQAGMECGIRVEKFDDVKEGDILETYEIEEIRRRL